MTQLSTKKNQQGLALLASIIIIVIFTIIGITMAQRAKENTKLSGAIVRYDVVFEAAEQTIRDAVRYIAYPPEIPIAGTGSNGRTDAANFNTATMDVSDVTINPNKSFIWDKGELEKQLCRSVSCNGGIDFLSKLDDDIWKNSGILSSFNDVDSKNYLREVQTYTFIQKLRTIDFGGGNTNSQKIVNYYLITVKASGYPPGTSDANKTPNNARENVILQAVFARR